MSNSKTVIVRNVELNFINLDRPHAPFGDMIWDTQVRTSDADSVAALEEAGVKMKEVDGVFQGNVKRKTMKKDGSDNTPVVVVDNNKQPWDASKRIGFGTKANIKLFTFEWSMSGRSGTSAILSAVQITDLVEYSGGDAVDFDVEAAAGF